jgi:uncharacterized Zn finger protein
MAVDEALNRVVLFERPPADRAPRGIYGRSRHFNSSANMARYTDRDYSYFPPSRPREAKGGIKAQSRQGGQSWWAKRWIAVLESFHVGARLQRGRSYARRGQVLSVDVGVGRVDARVQGSRPQPYSVTILAKTLSKADFAKLRKTLSQQAIFTAKLLAGEMPREIEGLFVQARLSLFPEKLDDLGTECSCPDWSNPCKHIAAVYYLIGEEFDRDPFLIFKLRGLNREKLVAILDDEAVKPAVASPPAGGGGDEICATSRPEPLSPAVAQFWHGTELLAGWLGEIQPPPITAALAKRLGKFPFWRGNQKFHEALEPLYIYATQRGQEVLLK